jgi:hypothetical protein
METVAAMAMIMATGHNPLIYKGQVFLDLPFYFQKLISACNNRDWFFEVQTPASDRDDSPLHALDSM